MALARSVFVWGKLLERFGRGAADWCTCRGGTAHGQARQGAGGRAEQSRGSRHGEEERKGEKKALTSGIGMSAAGALRGRGLLGWRWSRAELRQCGLENRGGAGPRGRKRREGRADWLGCWAGFRVWFSIFLFYFFSYFKPIQNRLNSNEI